MSERGAAPVLMIVIAAALGLGLAASGYLNYVQYQRSSDEKRQLTGEISDLRYQLKQDGQTPAEPTASPSPSPSASPDSAVSPTPVPAVAGAQALQIGELGVHVTPADPVADLTYSYQLVSGLAVANLTTNGMAAKNPGCKAGALGMLVRRPLSSKPSTSASHFIKKIGNYNYYYVTPTSNCGSSADGRAYITAAVAALTDTIMPALSE
jgi:hypothetical protein